MTRPDGIEAYRLRYTGRAGDLHAIDPLGPWYRTSIDAIGAPG
ncbi:hypothetical protein [Cryptosporangium japonicum]|uniref:Uncharacterized protein n=1 Tax=Cryptosporangium japonicum TaxID=80872 RepID=A0ABN0V8T9_9ACTN